MRSIFTLLMLSGIGYGIFWVNENHPGVKDRIEEFITSGSIHTLEVRYTAQQIMDTHRKDLLKDSRYKYLEPTLKFYPYLLLQVKYSLSEDKTQEGMMLWDLTDGELVIETKRWEKTHGFGDCIQANTDRQEFKILNTLAKRGGSCDRETLSKALHVENDILDGWIESCRRKRLIVQSGNRYRLHLQQPKLKTLPETKIDEELVTKSFKNATRMKRQFSLGQIQKISRAAFGNDFVVRQTSDVYLPVHCIVIQNPDGSIHTTLWNALTGQKIHQ
jgi:hypothetical protein